MRFETAPSSLCLPILSVANLRVPTGHFGEIYFYRGMIELQRNCTIGAIDKEFRKREVWFGSLKSELEIEAFPADGDPCYHPHIPQQDVWGTLFYPLVARASGHPPNYFILGAELRDLFDPLLPPVRRLERIREILCLVYDLAVVKLHDAHGVCRSPLIRDGVFRNPEVPVSDNPLDLEAGGLAGMMTPQGLQIASPEDALA